MMFFKVSINITFKCISCALNPCFNVSSIRFNCNNCNNILSDRIKRYLNLLSNMFDQNLSFIIDGLEFF